ncbi:hypothetical protein [Algoriphagus sp.]|uniref:hypothetical protein n=1 Tax=Algoriphagus sp. TaxID=1872435 RepID=UPI003F6EC394
MNFKFIPQIILFFFAMSVFVSCMPIDELFEKDNEGKISCIINGEPYEVEGGKSILSSEILRSELTRREGHFLLTIYGIKPVEDNKGLAIGFRIGGIDVADLKPDDVFTEWEVLDEEEGNFVGAMGGVEERTSGNTDYHELKASSNHTGDITLTISEIDTVGRLISGTFHFTAKDQISGDVQEVTDGVFEKIKWVEKGNT